MQLLESGDDEVIVGPSDRNFGFTMAAVFALIGAFGLYKESSHALIWLGIAAVFAGVTLWRPQSLGPGQPGLAEARALMYRVVNPVIMAILFFGAILPIGLAMRAVRQGFPPAWPAIVRRRPIGCRAPIRGRNLNRCGSNSRASPDVVLA